MSHTSELQEACGSSSPVRSLNVIILAGGRASRYKGGQPKHLVAIGGEPVLARTLRLLQEYQHSAGSALDMKISVVIPPGAQDYRAVVGQAAKCAERTRPLGVEDAKYKEALDLFHVGQDSLIILGDVFFSRSGLHGILKTSSTVTAITFFCRHESLPLINSGWGENFAIFVPAKEAPRFRESVEAVADMFKQGKIWRDSSWEIAKHLCGFDANNGYKEHPKLPVHHYLDDVTDDIDFVSDSERLKGLVPETLEEIREAYIELTGEVGRLYRMWGGHEVIGNEEFHWKWAESGPPTTDRPPIWHLDMQIRRILSRFESLETPDSPS